jgi:polyisoprenoid-binding protein YceI
MRAAAVALCWVMLLGADAAPERAIDVAASKAQFTVTHVFVEHVSGTIAIRSGSVTLPQGSVIPISATATLDPSSVNTGDHDRDSDLRGPDFFDAAKFPALTFASTKIVPRAANAFGMDGTITIHGTSQPQHLDVTIGGTPESPHYHAAGKIDRHAFGMAITRLDPVIGNTVDITLDIALRP